MRGVARRLSWGLGDQAVSSITNFVVGLYAARSLGVADFGVFTLAWVTYGVVLNISRGLATDPLMVRFSAAPIESCRAAVPRSSGTALLVGALAGGLAVFSGILSGGGVGRAFAALGVVLPAVLLQDSLRYAFFAAGQGRKAFTNDLVRAIALIPAMLLAAQDGSVVGFLLAWGSSAGISAVYGCIQIGAPPRLGAAIAWTRKHRDLGPRYVVENVSLSGSSQLRMYGLGAISGLAAVGTLRGAELLMGPFTAVMMGLGLFAVPEAARVLRRSPRRLPRFCLFLGGSQGLAALLWGLGVLLLLPDSVGQTVLGTVWQSASVLILPATLHIVLGSLREGAAPGLRALGASRRSMLAQLLNGAAALVGGLAGAEVAGAFGCAWGMVIGQIVGVAIWWWQLRAGLADIAATTASFITSPGPPEQMGVP
jgi:O-antigen/teichoic acid export membrane protein